MRHRAAAIALVTFACIMIFLPHYSGTSAREPAQEWQAAGLEAYGIHFKVPSDWPRRLQGINYDSEDHTAVSFIWRNPGNEGINLTIVTFKGGFSLLHGESATAAQKLEEEYGFILADTKGHSLPPRYGGLKKKSLGTVPGFLFIAHFAGLDEIGQPSEEIYWTGYRVFQGKTQEIVMELDSGLSRRPFLQTIIDTATVEQDRSPTEP